MEQDPQDPDASGPQPQAAQQASAPPYAGTDPGQTYAGASQAGQAYGQAYPGNQAPPPAGGPYGPPPGVPYGYPYGYAYPVRPATNTMAILALVFAFVFAPAAIVMGIVARKQIKRTGEDGMGLAIAGLVVGIVFTAFMVIYLIVVIVIITHMMNGIDQSNDVNGGVAAARAYLGI
jgi:preprotein translocase subunit SecG